MNGLFLLVGIFLVAFLTSYIAKKKNYSPIAWFFAGVFFGLIALLLIIFKKDSNEKYSKVDSKIEAKAIAEGNTRGSYTYYLAISDINNVWDIVRDKVLKNLEKYETRIKQNDRDRIYIEVEDSGFVQIIPNKYKSGNYIRVTSYNAGQIDFEEISNLLVDSVDTEEDAKTDRKFNMRYISIPLIAASVILFLFSLYESNEISCDEETTISLVKELTLPQIKEEYIIQKLAENDPSSRAFYKMAQLVGTENEIEGYEDLEYEAEKLFKNPNFLMKSFRTLNKNKELQTVECASVINVNSMELDVEYTSQLTDDGKEVVVNITSFLE